MPRRPSPRVRPRRALLPPTPEPPLRRRLLHRGLAALAVTGLGFAAAGSVVLTGSAQQAGPSAPTVVRVATPGVTAPAAFDRSSIRPTRAVARPALAAAQAEARAAGRTEALAGSKVQVAAENRDRLLARQAAAVNRSAAALRRSQAAKAAARKAAGRPTMPITSGYTTAARFGAVGSWSRYHTGFDFSAPLGTPVRTPQTGVVTVAGSGPASGWAGIYVTVRHPDGTSTLYAHLSGTKVRVGQVVPAGHVIGAVGLTGRTFGAHLHFELYPAGVTPGDVYKAVDPSPWLGRLGLKA